MGGQAWQDGLDGDPRSGGRGARSHDATPRKGRAGGGQQASSECHGRRDRMKFSRLIFANLFRKKVRLILTIGSFAVALFLFAFLAVVKSAFSRGTELAGADRLVTINRIGLINVLPLSYDDKIL